MFYISRYLGTNAFLLFFKFIWRSAYTSLLLFALLSPYKDKTIGKKEIKAVSKDIFIAIDLSTSMNAEDVVPSRLERTKYEIEKLCNTFKSDNIGFIPFSSRAYLQCPLTYDRNNLNKNLTTITAGAIGSGGTELYFPLKLALEKHLKNETIGNKAKVILLFTDGEEFGENTVEIAEQIKDNNIKVFTIGVGSQTGAKIPTERGFKTDNNGQTVITKLNSKSLRRLANLTGGKYFEISNTKNDINTLIKTINKIEGSERDKREVNDSKELKHKYFLYAALILILLDLIFVFRVVKL